MPRLNAIDPTTETGKLKETFDAVQKKLGMTPNIVRTMAHSPAALEGYLNLMAALEKGRLSAKLREQIAITVAEANACDYCLSAHTAFGKLVGVSEADLVASRSATSSDPKIAAALSFARQIVDTRGNVNSEQVARVREAGYGDGEISEIIANVAINVFTNYFNLVAQTEVDFPKVSAQSKTA